MLKLKLQVKTLSGGFCCLFSHFPSHWYCATGGSMQWVRRFGRSGRSDILFSSKSPSTPLPYAASRKRSQTHRWPTHLPTYPLTHSPTYFCTNLSLTHVNRICCSWTDTPLITSNLREVGYAHCLNMQWHPCLEHSIFHMLLRIYLYIEWWPHKYMCKDTYITMLIVSAMFYHMSKFWYPRYCPNSLLSFWLTNAWHITQFAILLNINDENNTTSTFPTFSNSQFRGLSYCEWQSQ